MANTLIILSAMAAWGALHSILASLTAKARARQLLGLRTADAVYRLLYNIAALVTFLPVMALVGILPDQPLYRFPAWLTFITVPIQFVAVLALTIALLQVDLPRFIGLRQLIRWSEGKPDPRDPPRLYTGGIYGWVRHPLYFFSLVFIWLTPIMTFNVLTFNIAATLYLWIGSIFEERKLVAEFGEAYREHQRRVPRLFPVLWRKT
ncbi:MAG TPA: isoprenylcysteine carboxylmethyltransferase family protein [Anaerolineales bacterium]|nr:isoprenylcysteine carboxylmethyltransferase family protein [Anaerolineales bacterium]